jgi:cyclase
MPRAYRRTAQVSLVACALALPPVVPAHAQTEIPINSRRLSDRVLLTWACDYFQGTNMAVVVTAQGLLIIDTGLSPSTVRRQRELIEQELGRSDFRWLIDTHMHNDHAFANSVFPEATVVGHAHGADALRREVNLIPELTERLRRGRASYAEAAAATSPDGVDGKRAREGVAAFDVGLADLEAGIEPRYPTMTFDVRDTLDLGDVHALLFDFTGFHSDSDILILLPEQRILFTGDVFWGGQLPVLGETTAADVQRLLDNWTAILDAAPDLATVVPGHSDVPLTVDQFRQMHAYFSRLWADVRDAKAAGTPLVRFLLQHVFGERYPEVAGYTFVRRDYNLHQHNVTMLWQAAGR